MYEQKMCYIDLYRNGVKCGNMGHVRMEWDEERYRFGASLCHMDRQTLVTAMLERTGGRPRTTIQNIAIIHGKGSAQFDWMPLEGNEERLLFQASGQIYGVCVLPKMRTASKQDIGETAEQNQSVFFTVKPEIDSQLKEKQSEMQNAVPGAAPQREKMQGDVQNVMPEAAPWREEKRSGMTEAASQSKERQSGMLEAVLRTMEKQSEVQNTMPEEVPQRGKMPSAAQNIMPEAASQREEKQSSGSVTATGRETQSAMREREWHEEAVQEISQERERHEAVRERSQERGGKGAPQNTVVLTYPQGEERRRRERHVTNLSDDKWKQLCSIYPTVHPIGDDVEFIKITPADFVILRQEYQNLVRNSFLLHGYYNYEHILLGKYPDKYYIGVPGIMHEQERIAAAMFGFVGFERAEAPKEQKENRDRFGYYMMEVGI